MPASRELLVLGNVARRAVLGRQMAGHDESLMIQLFLILLRLMTVETVDSLCGMSTGFKLVNYRGSFPAMAFGAFPGGLYEARQGLPYVHLRPHGVEQHGRYDNGRTDEYRNEHRRESCPVHVVRIRPADNEGSARTGKRSNRTGDEAVILQILCGCSLQYQHYSATVLLITSLGLVHEPAPSLVRPRSSKRVDCRAP